jgi:phosphonate transport system substrate-binding protein
VTRRSYEDIIIDIGNGIIDLALLDPLAYLEAHAKYGVKCILKPKDSEGNSFNYSVIVASKDSDVRSLSDLKGKSFAFASTKSTWGNLIPRYLLADNGMHLNDLKTYKNFNYYDSVAKAVLRGFYDAGAVKEEVEKRYEKKGLKIIATSSSFQRGPIVVRSELDPEIVNNIKKTLLKLNNIKMMRNWNENIRYGFTEASDKDYEPIRKMINRVPKGCGMGCHPDIKL